MRNLTVRLLEAAVGTKPGVNGSAACIGKEEPFLTLRMHSWAIRCYGQDGQYLESNAQIGRNWCSGECDEETASMLTGLQIVLLPHHMDHRGTMYRVFDSYRNRSRERAFGAIQINVVRINEAGTLKGFHFQKPPIQEVKIVACLVGRVWDVALDLRPESETYGQHFAIELNGNVPVSLLIPEGFAHGVQCLEPGSVMHYIHSAPYSPEHEAGVNALDPDLGINWPLPPTNLSERDRNLPGLKGLES